MAPSLGLFCIPRHREFHGGLFVCAAGLRVASGGPDIGLCQSGAQQAVSAGGSLADAVPGHALYTDSNPFWSGGLLFVYVLFILCAVTRDRAEKYLVAAVLSILALVLCVQMRTSEYHSGQLTAVAVDVGQGPHCSCPERTRF